MNGWREDHTLTLEAYGTGAAHGSWCLLEPTRAASPILDYHAGKYRVGDAWLRASADALLHHTGSELASARETAKAQAAELEAREVARELDTGAIDVGDKVQAKGLAPDGDVKWFEAVVVGKRTRLPPLKVMYLRAIDGSVGVPSPSNAHVPFTHVKALL